MTGLSKAGEITRNFILNGDWTHQPTRIVFYADNSAAISRIYKGMPGKAQKQSLAFRKHIQDILNKVEEAIVAISWVPGHANIAGNEIADHLTKKGAKLRPKQPNLKTQAFVASYTRESYWKHEHTTQIPTQTPSTSPFTT